MKQITIKLENAHIVLTGDAFNSTTCMNVEFPKQFAYRCMQVALDYPGIDYCLQDTKCILYFNQENVTRIINIDDDYKIEVEND